MKPLAAKKLVKILQANGFYISRQKGSHLIMKNNELGTMVPIPLHGGNRLLPIGTFLAIIKQSKLLKDLFI